MRVVLTGATVVSRVTAFIRALVAFRRGDLVAALVALTSLLVSATAAATTQRAATSVNSTREVQSADCHVSVIPLRVPHDRAIARRLGAPDARSEASTTGRALPPSARGRRGNDPINSTDISGLLKGVPDWLLWLDDHGVLQGAGDFSAGVSSALTFELSDKLIGATGLGKYGSKCSGWYFGGELGGMVLGIVQGPAALAKGAAVEGAEATASIYRAVSAAEFADIFAIGGFRAAPGVEVDSHEWLGAFSASTT